MQRLQQRQVDCSGTLLYPHLLLRLLLICSLGFTKPLNRLLQGLALEAVQAYRDIERLKYTAYDKQKITKIQEGILAGRGAIVGCPKVAIPRISYRQTTRCNVPADLLEKCWRRSIFNIFGPSI